MIEALRIRLESLLDRYRIEGEAAEGGMAVVFLARDLKHDRRVALKVMKPDLAGSSAPERFLREIDIAAKLSHPHILPVYDSGEVDGIHYIVMPFVEDESLRDRLDRESALPLAEAVRLTSEIASGLTYAHRQGLVHRDVKPENILLQSGHATVTDFGIARIVEGDGAARFTGTGASVGTVAYMSPEQAAGDDDIDGRTDVYALGCVLYEMLEGAAPFAGRSPQSVLAAKITGEVPALSRTEEVPATVIDVIHTALAPDREDRPATPADLVAALETAMSREAIEAAAARDRRVRLVRIGAGIAGVALAGVAAAWLTNALAGPSMGRIAVLPLENERNDTTQAFFIDGMHDALITEMQQAGLSVIGPTSVRQYRDSDAPVRQIATDLDVDGVITGFAYYDGDSVGLRLRLVDGESQTGIWNQEFGASASGIVRLYRQATGEIADRIGFDLTPEVASRLASAPPVDPAALEAYMNGRGHWNRLAPEDLGLAQEYFERALEIAPDYALGHVGMAMLWGGLQQMGLMSPQEAAPKIRESVGAALEADSTIAEAHFAAAALHTWTDWDWEAGEAAFLRAIELNPSYADGRIYYAHLLTHLGRPEEALEQARIAVELEPVSPLIRSLRCAVLANTRRFDEALTECQTVLDRDPRQIVALDAKGVTLQWLGRQEEHLENQIVRARELGLTWLADVLERSYRANGFESAMGEAADTMIAKISRGEFVPPGQVARYLADARRSDEALDWLERAFDLHAPSTPYGLDVWWPEEVRSSPRFRAVYERMGLLPRE